MTPTALQRKAGFPSDDDVVAALSMAPAIGLGVARFAYALILPDMRADLGWSYEDAGLMNASNAAGYLLGALLAARTIASAGAFRVLMAGVWLCIASLFACALFRQAAPLNAARFLAGFGAALGFIAGGLLATKRAQRDPSRATFVLSLFYAGPGLGILVSGASVPFVLAGAGPGSWRWAWMALALLCLALASGLYLARNEDAGAQTQAQTKPPLARMRAILLGYFMFGAGYIAYMTFMIAWIQRDAGGAGFQSLFWCVLGAAGMASPWAWAWALKRLVHGYAFAFLNGVTALGAALPLLSASPPLLLASAVLFGAGFFAVVASTTVFVRRNLPPSQWAPGIGALTVAFGVGQTFGPLGIGYLNDRWGGLSGGLGVSVAFLVLAAFIGATQRDLDSA